MAGARCTDEQRDWAAPQRVRSAAVQDGRGREENRLGTPGVSRQGLGQARV